MQFSANISTMFSELPFSDRFNEASQHGFKAVEVQFLSDTDPLSVIIDGIAGAGNIELVLMNSPYKPGPIFPEGDFSFDSAHCAAMNYATGTKSLVKIVHRDPSEIPKLEVPTFGMACLPNFELEFNNSIKECMRICDLLNCRKLHIISGLLHEEYPSFEMCESAYLFNLKWAVEELEEYQIVTLIEPICAETKPNYFLSSFEQAVKYIEEINSDYLKLLLDVYHLYKIEGDVEAGLKKYLPYAGHVQISQSPGRHDPFLEGDINYARVLEIIKNSDYKGHIGLEYTPVGENPNFDWIKNYIEEEEGASNEGEKDDKEGDKEEESNKDKN